MIKKYFLKYKWSILGGQFFKLIEAILELIVPLLVAKIIDYGLNVGSMNYVLRMGLYIFILGVVGFICACICQYLAAYTSEKVGKDLRNEIFEQLKRLSYKQIDDISKDSLVIRMTLDIERIQLMIAMYIRIFVRAPFILIGALIMCMFINFKLSLIVLVVLIVLLILIIVLYKVVPQRVLNIQKRIDQFTLLIRETIVGNKVIRGFNYQDDLIYQFDEKNKKLRDENLVIGRILGSLDPAVNVILYTGYIFVLLIGANFINRGVLLRGDIVAYTGYLSTIIAMWVIAIKLITIFLNGMASFKRIEDLLLQEPEIVYGTDEDYREIDIALKCEDIKFSYNGGNQVLKDISLSFKSGKSYGIIGGTGSGKSTLINVLTGKYKLDSGKIEVFGKNISRYSLKGLNKIFSIANQRGKLESNTILNNIKWGDYKASEEEVLQIADITCLDGLIRDKGLDFKLIEKGDNISGGQKQRMVIARSLIKKAPILILDDSFSALDFKTEEMIVKRLLEIKKTLIIVSQRVSSIRECDEIIVMDAGEVVDVGSHDELMLKSRVYKEIVESQIIDEDSN